MKNYIFALLAVFCLVSPVAAEEQSSLTTLPTMTVVATSLEPEVREALKAYQADLTANLNRFRHYPERAVRRNIEGTVLVRFELNFGEPNITLIEEGTRAHSILQTAALETMAAAVKATPVPELVAGEQLAIRFPYVYKLED